MQAQLLQICLDIASSLKIQMRNDYFFTNGCFFKYSVNTFLDAQAQALSK